MKTRAWVLFLLLVALLGLPAPARSDQLTIDSEAQLRFARQYMVREDYGRAVTELERLVYFFPRDSRVPEAQYLIGVCHLKNRDYETARQALEAVYRAYPEETIAGKALFLIGESYYIQGLPEEAGRYFKRVVRDYPEAGVKDAALYRLGWSHLQADRWQEAAATFQTVDEHSVLYESARSLSEHGLEGELLPYKDPLAAGVMAGVLPGLGHAYCGRYKDGVLAFLVNGLFLWAAVESFDNDQEVLGGILAFLELGWYTGNIYSAVNGAHKHNLRVRNEFRRSLPDRLDLDPFTSKKRDLGLSLRFDF
jgi:tetratricopeptide (TPR) repeat protein